MAFSYLISLSLLTSSVLASSIQARSPILSLPVQGKMPMDHLVNIVKKDQARGKALISGGNKKSVEHAFGEIPVSAQNDGVLYTAEVGVGSGTYKLIIDTGSSNTWVGAGQPYMPSPNSKDTHESVGVKYGSGFFLGEEFLDDVTLGSATISQQSIGVASNSSGLDGFDGILGLGPDALTEGTTSGGGIIPTVTDNLAAQGDIELAIVGISFKPTINLNEMSGMLDFGGIDPSQILAPVVFVPITKAPTASKFWGIDQSISYGSERLEILPTVAGIVDTGTTLVLISTQAFEIYRKATGSVLDPATGLLMLDSPTQLESLYFNVAGVDLEFTSNAQIWPRSLNTEIGGTQNATYLIVNDIGEQLKEISFINGYTFLQRYYSVYDSAHQAVGLAATPHTHDVTN